MNPWTSPNPLFILACLDPASCGHGEAFYRAFAAAPSHTPEPPGPDDGRDSWVSLTARLMDFPRLPKGVNNDIAVPWLASIVHLVTHSFASDTPTSGFFDLRRLRKGGVRGERHSRTG